MTIEELLKINQEQHLQILGLKQQLADLQRMVFGKKSERFIPDSNGQLNMFSSEQESQSQAPPAAVTIEKHTRKKSKHKGRTLIAALSHLPVEEVYLEVPHSENSECIGKVEKSTLGFTPGKLYIQKEIIKKYRDPKTGHISPAKFPPQPIDRCEAHPTLLKSICVGKFVDHLPEYRQNRFLKETVWISHQQQ